MFDHVRIVDYHPHWPAAFRREVDRLREVVESCGGLRIIEHIGSTAVPGLAAKPIIDIMIAIEELAIFNECWIDPLASMGYTYKPEYEDFFPERRFCSRFETGDSSFAKVNLHIVEPTSAFWERHLLFRDYLRAHPDTAAAYAMLKRRLAAKHRTDREAYTDAKTEFIERAITRAREQPS